MLVLLKIERYFSNKTRVFATSNYTKVSAIEIKCQWLFQEESHETFARNFTRLVSLVGKASRAVMKVENRVLRLIWHVVNCESCL